MSTQLTTTKVKVWNRVLLVVVAVAVGLAIQNHVAASETEESDLQGSEAQVPHSEDLEDLRSEEDRPDETIRQLCFAQALIENAQRARRNNGLLYARELLNKAAQIAADTTGPDSPEYGLCLGHEGSVDLDLYRFNDAIDELQKAKSIVRQHRKLYKFHSIIAVDCNLAFARRNLGDTDIAVQLYDEVVRDCNSEGYTDNVDRVTILLCLANSYLDLNDLDKASTYLEAVQQKSTRELKENNGFVGALNAALGRYYYLKKDYAKSTAHFEQALDDLRKSDTAPPTKYAEVAYDFSTSLSDQTKYAEAISVLADKADEIEKHLGRDHPLVHKIQQKTVAIKTLRDNSKPREN